MCIVRPLAPWSSCGPRSLRASPTAIVECGGLPPLLQTHVPRAGNVSPAVRVPVGFAPHSALSSRAARGICFSPSYVVAGSALRDRFLGFSCLRLLPSSRLCPLSSRLPAEGGTGAARFFPPPNYGASGAAQHYLFPLSPGRWSLIAGRFYLSPPCRPPHPSSKSVFHLAKEVAPRLRNLHPGSERVAIVGQVFVIEAIE